MTARKPPPLTPTQMAALRYVAEYAPNPRGVHTSHWGSQTRSEGMREATVTALALRGLIVTTTRRSVDHGRDGGTYWQAHTTAAITPAGAEMLRGKTNGAPAKSPGVWFDVRPSADAQRILAASGTEPAGRLHGTLVYLGRADQLPRDFLPRAREALHDVADRFGPVRATSGGLRRFPGEPLQPVYVVLESPPLVKLRAALARALRAGGLAVDRTHAFVPHITVGNAEPGEVWPYPTPPRLALEFRALSLWVGPSGWHAPLRGAG